MTVTIIGAGAYGLALSYCFLKNNNKVIVYSKVDSEIDDLLNTSMNKRALGDFVMPKSIIYTKDISFALLKSDIVVIAVATKYLYDICLSLKPYINNKHVVIASKGIDQERLAFASNIVKNTLKIKKLCTISGPSFARDMISNSLIGLSLAATNNSTRKIVTKALENKYLKIRPTNDFIGVELSGTMKNIIAIVAGMLDGLNASESTKAMFLTESINDIRILMRKMKASEKTILSYAGFGDIILTCTSINSRNYSYGKLIGSKKTKEELDNYLKNNTVEGYYTLISIYNLLRRKKIKLPIINVMYDIIINNQNPEKIYTFLREK